MPGFSFNSALIALPERDPQWAEEAAFRLRSSAGNSKDASLKDWAERASADQQLLEFLGFIFRHSPFLSHCALRDLAFLKEIWEHGPDTCFTRLVARMKDDLAGLADRDQLMCELRLIRRRVALLTGLADIAGHWPLDRVTQALSDFADGALSASISHLLRQAAETGDINLVDPYFPEDQCGYVTLAMGKHGGRELNYSSDIDLIVIYEPTQIDYRGSRSHQQFVERLTRNLIAIMQEVTVDGYVCRVDLNLRPDPSATPLAVSMAAAQTYYRNRGENWERAAMIKARPAAGDLALGRQFLDSLTPFIWRESMDFWLLQDMRRMKRRINAHKGGGDLGVAGHNVKLGRGGIREIEFYAQTQQLIYGGADPYLRCSRTVEALTTLAEAGHISEKAADELTESYEFLRQLEHRLQMVDDQQTQTMPSDADGIQRMASFMAFDGVDEFEAALLENLARVESYFSRLFETTPGDGIPAADWSFLSERAEDRTLAAIKALGFADSTETYRRLRRWHHAGFRSCRSDRARKMLCQLVPEIARAAARTPDPDATLEALEAFLSRLPSGLRLLSTVSAHANLLGLLFEIITLSPRLADELVRHSERLQLATAPAFFGLLPDARVMRVECADIAGKATDMQGALDNIGSRAQDYRFQIAVNLLRHTIDAHDAGLVLSDLADAITEQVRAIARTKAAGDCSGEAMAVVAIGAWGRRELAPAAPAELLFICDEDDAGPSCKMARQVVGICAASSSHGPLCLIETSRELWGAPGPIVVSLDAFVSHLAHKASAEQLIALADLRVVCGPPEFRTKIENAARTLLTSQSAADILRDHVKAHIDDVEALAGFQATNDLFLCAEILVTLDESVRSLQVRHARTKPKLMTPSIPKALNAFASIALVNADLVRQILDIRHRLRQVEAMRGARFGHSSGDNNNSARIDSEMLLAAGIIDATDWWTTLSEGRALLREIRDRYLK